jgi:Spy/CpxP family protein refolding chaperone
MKLSVSILSAVLLAASSTLYAQAPKADEGKGRPARQFDCSKAKDPQACEARVAKMREARDKARKACEGKTGDERRQCMEKSFCSGAADPAKCEANLKERDARRQQMREACKDKKGDELKACMRDFRASHRDGNKAGAEPKPAK